MEDLWAFNDEVLARTVAASKIPVISAVGHETDFTICDFAADLRAPTPSAAAELAVPETEDIKRRLENINVRNRTNIQNKIALHRSRLEQIRSVGIISSPERLLDGRRMNVIYCSEKLGRFYADKCNEGKVRLAKTAAKLEALNPLGIISRGYSAVTDKGGSVIRSVSELKRGDSLRVRFADGEAEATVENLIKKDRG
jgi:exodeoxyribonuclease VII large subunit